MRVITATKSLADTTPLSYKLNRTNIWPKEIFVYLTHVFIMSIADATILIVDDEESLVTVYKEFLADAKEVITAIDGEEALERIDGAVDLVILDRRMPGLSGDDVLDELRERGYNCPVIMVTAVTPDKGITSMRFNEYVQKPVNQEELLSVVDQVLQLSKRDVILQEYFSQMDKLLALENELNLEGLYEDDEYQKVLAHVESLREEIDDPFSQLEDDIAQRLHEKWPNAKRDPWLA